MKNYLKKHRILANKTQKEVSDHLGYITPQFVSNWERGLSTPPIKDLKAIAKLYKLNQDELTTRLINAKMCELMDRLQAQIDKES